MRALIVFLLSLFLFSCASTSAQLASTGSAQEGFGGTGVVAKADESGFGGTGVIGTIEAFGSIYVNNLHIQIDDKSGIQANIPGTYDLALGQQVMLTTTDAEAEIRAEQIQLHFPVAGEVSDIKRNLLIVNGEWVRWSNETQIDPKWSSGRTIEAGEQVIVSGWLRSDGTWMATRLSANPDAIQTVSKEIIWPFAGEQKQFVVEQALHTGLSADLQGYMQNRVLLRSGRFSSGTLNSATPRSSGGVGQGFKSPMMRGVGQGSGAHQGGRSR